MYPSYLLGYDSYALLDLGGSGVSWHQKGFVPDSNDPLAQRATMGYKLWTGAKVLDPMAICVIYSTSAYSTALADFSNDPFGRAASQIADGVTVTLASIAGVVVGATATATATVLDGNENAVTAFADDYSFVWASDDTDIATVAAASSFGTATVTGVGAGTATITVSIYKNIPGGLTLVDSASANVVVSAE